MCSDVTLDKFSFSSSENRKQQRHRFHGIKKTMVFFLLYLVFFISPDPGQYCPAEFDDVLCWKAAPENTTAVQPCIGKLKDKDSTLILGRAKTTKVQKKGSTKWSLTFHLLPWLISMSSYTDRESSRRSSY